MYHTYRLLQREPVCLCHCPQWPHHPTREQGPPGRSLALIAQPCCVLLLVKSAEDSRFRALETENWGDPQHRVVCTSDTESKTVGRLIKKLETVHNTCNVCVHCFRGCFSSEFAENSELRKDAGWRILEFPQPPRNPFIPVLFVLQEEEARLAHHIE